MIQIVRWLILHWLIPLDLFLRVLKPVASICQHYRQVVAYLLEIQLSHITVVVRFINGDTLIARITPCLENGKAAYINILNGEKLLLVQLNILFLARDDHSS